MQSQNLQIVPKGVKPIIRASQSDVGRTFQLKLYDGAMEYTPPTGTTLRLDGIKPDKTAFSYTDNLTLSGSVITVTCNTQLTLIPGTVQCEIRMTNGSEDIGTINFDLMVEKSPINGTTDLSQTEVPALVALARVEMEDAEAWAVGTKNGEPVGPDDPQYHNNAKYLSEQISGEGTNAEAWAVGTKDGEPVGPDDPQYHNNSKYYAQEAGSSATAAGTAATNASSSAQSASSSATAAGTSASNAAAAATRAEAAVVKGPYIGANGNWFVYDFTTQQYTDTNIKAQGPQGPQGIQGLPGEDGTNGTDGVGIVSITKTATQGLVDTYTVLLTNGQTYTFTVTNGQNGTGSGDMMAANYDPTQAVYNAGGIVAYVASQISGLSTSLSGLTDVALTSLAAGQSLVYDATAQKWVNGSISASDVNYANTTSGLAATKVQAAIDEVAAKNQTLTNEVSDISDEIADMNNILGAKNLLFENNALNITLSGITFVVNSDGSVTANGTATDTVYYNVSNDVELPKGEYILNGCPSGGAIETYYMYLEGTGIPVQRDLGDGASYNFANDVIAKCYISIANGYTADNLVFKPMLRPASIKDDTYVPYSMTNREMTPYVQAISNPNLLDNPWFTVNQRGQSNYNGNVIVGVDRWHLADLQVDVVANGVDLTVQSASIDGNFFLTHSLDELLVPMAGKTVTLSIITDGELVSVSSTLPSTFTETTWINLMTVTASNGVNVALLYNADSSYRHAQVSIRAPKDGNTYNVRAVKLEIGSISTLALDTAPNYQQELAKCQRYFNRIGHASEYVGVGVGQAWTDNVACIHVPLSVPMRAKPNVTQSGSAYATLRNQQTVIGTVSSYTVDGVGQNEIMLRFGTSNTPLTAGLVYEAFLAGGRYIDLSADI